MQTNKYKTYQKTPIILMVILLSYLAGQIINAVLMQSLSPELSVKIMSLSENDVNEISLLKILQFISAVFSFLIPALIISKLFTQDAKPYISYRQSPGIWYYLLIPVLLISVMPLMNIIIQWNESIVLPESLSNMEVKMKEMEASSQKMIELLLSGNSFLTISLNFILIALLPALGEEFLFRGVIQKHGKELFKNSHIAIFVAAFLFSAIHFQFYGFIPRLLLGMVFGYLVYFSGSIWPAVFAHFINNSMAIAVCYLSKTSEIAAETNTFGTKASDIYFVISGLVLAGVVSWVMIKRYRVAE
ncbi:MAG: CPBP family intramembrane metalloprotease [Bacteroidales bacterium]|nr:CPBP family intramembrane metalloprotease [Bacteroidales bacterium]